jgi:hypothetical protein
MNMKKYNNANKKPIGNPMPAMKIPLEMIAEMSAAADAGADPNGSDTGRVGRVPDSADTSCACRAGDIPSDPGGTAEKPVQDADDL